jgi:hypothetical protein
MIATHGDVLTVLLSITILHHIASEKRIMMKFLHQSENVAVGRMISAVEVFCSYRKLKMITNRIAVQDLKVGDQVRWVGLHGIVEGRIHELEERNNLRTIRVEPFGSGAGTFKTNDKLDVVVS